MNTDIKIHFLHESGKSFPELAGLFGISQFDAAKAWARVDSAKDKAKNKVKVVYRRKLTTNKSHHKTLVKKMRTL